MLFHAILSLTCRYERVLHRERKKEEEKEDTIEQLKGHLANLRDSQSPAKERNMPEPDKNIPD